MRNLSTLNINIHKTKQKKLEKNIIQTINENADSL